jgi:gamma-glutamylcyclotransferase
MGGTFLYFAYGSNLLTKRIHINNPSAVRVGIGKLMNYQLDFAKYSERWRGASATIVKSDKRHVWGAIWEIGLEHMESLDRH